MQFLMLTEPPGDYEGHTNEDLVMYYDEWEAALNSCNRDKLGIMEWVRGSKEILSDRASESVE